MCSSARWSSWYDRVKNTRAQGVPPTSERANRRNDSPDATLLTLTPERLPRVQFPIFGNLSRQSDPAENGASGKRRPVVIGQRIRPPASENRSALHSQRQLQGANAR